MKIFLIMRKDSAGQNLVLIGFREKAKAERYVFHLKQSHDPAENFAYFVDPVAVV